MTSRAAATVAASRARTTPGGRVVVMAHGQANAETTVDHSPTLTCLHEAPIAAIPAPPDVAHTLRAEGFDASEDGTGRRIPLVPITFAPQAAGKQTRLGYRDDGVSQTLGANQVPAVVFDPNQITSPVNQSRPKAQVCHTLPAHKDPPHLAGSGTVRRLTPRECERLQGFPDGHTLVPASRRAPRKADDLAYLREQKPDLPDVDLGKLAADGPRYKSTGNSMPVNVMEWIGERIALVGARLAQGLDPYLEPELADYLSAGETPPAPVLR